MTTQTQDPVDLGQYTEPELDNSIGAILRRRYEAIKAGDAGVLPVLVGLLAIVVFFTAKNSNFLTAPNFTNLIGQMAAVTTIAIGVVFVLLLGEIDLSIGYVSGVAGVVVAKLQLPDSSWEIKGIAAIAIAVIVGSVIGLLQGSIVAKIGVPSFVVTLAGLLFWQGVILQSIGDTGVITIQDSTINNVANYYFGDTVGIVVAVAAAFLFAAMSVAGVVNRRRHVMTSDNAVVVGVKLTFISFFALGAVGWACQ